MYHQSVPRRYNQVELFFLSVGISSCVVLEVLFVRCELKFFYFRILNESWVVFFVVFFILFS